MCPDGFNIPDDRPKDKFVRRGIRAKFVDQAQKDKETIFSWFISVNSTTVLSPHAA